MRPSTICALCAALATSAGSSAAEPVRVTGGVIEGTNGTDPSVRVFRGVPFAAPPVGPLRWTPPRPVTPWTGTRQADTWGARCMQAPMWGQPLVSREAGMSEDCLYLNVWTTARGPAEKRPVLFVIHGGGFAQGSASEPRTDGEWFAKQGIVVVAPNYRLGVFGFLAHPELSRESDGKGSGNYGLLDQAAALEWVRANVSAFGGDPDQVTINGESAGSYSVSALMASPLTKALFHKAIGQSGAFFPSPRRDMWEKTLAEKEQDGLAFAHSVGAKSLTEMRERPAADLLGAMMARNGGWGWSPGLDGHFLTERVAQTYAAGRQAKVPLLAGWTSSELGMAVAMNPQKPTVASFADELERQFGESRAAAAAKAYPAADDAQAQQAAADLAGDLFIAYSTWKWIEVHAAHAPVYRYRFERALPAPDGSNRFGALHASDIEYAFATLDSKPGDWAPEDRRTSATFSGAFAHFVKTGTPNGPGVPEWPEYGRTRQVMYVDAVSRVGPDRGRSRYELIDEVAPRAAGVEVRTHSDTGFERQGREQLLRILATYPLDRWRFTSTVLIQSRVIPHSHPVLTLNTRYLDDDVAQLANYVHEQLHWFLTDHVGRPRVEAAIAELRALYPDAPAKPPEGAQDQESSYLHLIVCLLEKDALSALLGEDAARRQLAAWTHYTWVYQKVLEEGDRIRPIVDRHVGAVPRAR
jgi:para-nitrobenzyl esterase